MKPYPEGTTEKCRKGRQEETQASMSGAIPLSSAKCTPVPHTLVSLFTKFVRSVNLLLNMPLTVFSDSENFGR